VTRSVWRKSPGNQPVPSARPGGFPAAPVSVVPACPSCPRGLAARFPHASAENPASQATENPLYITGYGPAEPVGRSGGAAPVPCSRRASPRPAHRAADRPAAPRCGHPAAPPAGAANLAQRQRRRQHHALANAGACVKSRQVSCAMFGIQVCTAKTSESPDTQCR
jgi:hypothetical protein